MQGPIEHRIIGIELLARLTAEMNQISDSDANKSLTKHRKIASSYRDQHLYSIFQLACAHLRSQTYDSFDFSDESKHNLILQLIQLGDQTNSLFCFVTLNVNNWANTIPLSFCLDIPSCTYYLF